MSQEKRRRLTAEQKPEAVRLVKEVRSIAKAARILDLHATVFSRWVKQAKIDAGEGQEGALKTDEKDELRRPRREVRTLKMDRHFLEEATTLFTKDRDQQSS